MRLHERSRYIPIQVSYYAEKKNTRCHHLLIIFHNVLQWIEFSKRNYSKIRNFDRVRKLAVHRVEKYCRAIQVLSDNSLVVADQNVPITSILTNCTLGSWKDFDVDLSLIGSKEVIWKTCYDTLIFVHYASKWELRLFNIAYKHYSGMFA